MQNQIMQWRRAWIPTVVSLCEGRVQSGPFKGMAITPDASWGDGDIMAKLLGVYESSLHAVIDQIQAQQWRRVINLGAAEGYYAVGLARLLDQPVIAVDSDPTARLICARNAAVNQVSVEVQPAVCESEFGQLVGTEGPVLIVMDVEGAEQDLLTPTHTPELLHCSILVESHDCIRAGVTNQLQQRFQATHCVTLWRSEAPDAWQFPVLDSWSDLQKMAMVLEGRPQTGTWLWMQPR